MPILSKVTTPKRFIVKKTATMSASNTTASVTLFTVTGSVKLHKIWGEVTTAIGSNHTAGHLRLNDGTNTPALTLAAGTTLSSVAAGSIIYKGGVAAEAVVLINNSQARVNESSTAGIVEPTIDTLPAFQECVLTAKTGATTTIEYRYTTTQTPTTGVIVFYADFEPISADGSLA